MLWILNPWSRWPALRIAGFLECIITHVQTHNNFLLNILKVISICDLLLVVKRVRAPSVCLPAAYSNPMLDGIAED